MDLTPGDFVEEGLVQNASFSHLSAPERAHGTMGVSYGRGPEWQRVAKGSGDALEHARAEHRPQRCRWDRTPVAAQSHCRLARKAQSMQMG
jgi:hypothetical protein